MNSYPACILLFAVIIGALACPAPTAAEAPAPGTLLWQHQVGAQIWSPLTHDQGVLYFGCDDGRVVALDTARRASRWEFETGGRVRSAVTVAAGKAYLASDDGYLYALDLATGEEAWRFDLGSAGLERRLPATTPPYEYDYLHSSPVVVDGTVFIGSMDGNLYAIDAGSGRERWRFATEGRIRATPAVDDGTVYCGSWDGNLYAVNALDGEPRWQFDTGGIVQETAALAAGKVVIGSRGTRIRALDADSGEPIWEYVHKDGSWVESSPVIRDGVVYIGSSDALKLFAFDLETGRRMWSFKTNGWSWSTPVVADRVVYIGGISAHPYYFDGVVLEGGFYAVDAQEGALRWSMTPGPIEGYITGGVFSSPVVAGQVVYVASLDGIIHALQE